MDFQYKVEPDNLTAGGKFGILFKYLKNWRVVRVVEGAALEMLCGETHLGFESLTLRQTNHRHCLMEQCR